MSERIDNLREELEETPEEAPTTETEPKEETVEDVPDAVEEDEEEEIEDDDIPDKFKGKSVKEIIQSYKELEKTIGQRPIGKEEREVLKEAGVKRKDLEELDNITELIKKQDFSNMDPQKFAEFILNMTDKRAEVKARAIYDQATSVQQAVKTELAQATKEFPLLKSNQEFRELVLALIEQGASQGKQVSLIEASKKVSGLLQIEEKKEKDDTPKVRKKTAVETTPKNGGGKQDTDEEKVLKGILGAKQSSTLGGLGV